MWTVGVARDEPRAWTPDITRLIAGASNAPARTRDSCIEMWGIRMECRVVDVCIDVLSF
jgi:hypothetical protein